MNGERTILRAPISAPIPFRGSRPFLTMCTMETFRRYIREGEREGGRGRRGRRGREVGREGGRGRSDENIVDKICLTRIFD